METVKKYFNSKQLECMKIAANNEYIIASRGFGKSEGIDAPRLVRNVFAMPRSAGALLSPTYGKLLRNTLPAIFHALERLGYKRNIHYFVGRKPDKRLKFNNPIIDPFSYDYVISWFNGSIQHLISFDRTMSANSMSLDYILGFEAKFLDYEKIKNEVLPANRGNLNYFGNCPWHHGQLYTTDMPTQTTGLWLLEKEKEMDRDLIDLIRYTYLKHKRALKFEPENLTKINRLTQELSKFRSKATFYAEYDVFDNIGVLGESFVKNMKRDLAPLEFQTAILNIRRKKIPNGFYSSFSDKIHCYSSYNNSYLDGIDYNFEHVTDCRSDGDVSHNKRLIISNDYNAAINSLVVGQLHGNELRTIKSIYVKTPRKLRDVVQDFCDYYYHHPNRTIDYIFDSTAIYETPTSGESFADLVIKVLQENRFDVNQIYIGKPIKHYIKHNYINQAFKGEQNYPFPTFNRDNNEYLILAMQNTGINTGINGFQKDKSAEKLPDTPELPDERKTHITDAWDTMFLGVLLFYSQFSNVIVPGTVYNE